LQQKTWKLQFPERKTFSVNHILYGLKLK